MAFREYCTLCDTYGDCLCNDPERLEARAAQRRAEQAAREEALREEGRQQERAAVLVWLRSQAALAPMLAADARLREQYTEGARQLRAHADAIEAGKHVLPGVIETGRRLIEAVDTHGYHEDSEQKPEVTP